MPARADVESIESWALGDVGIREYFAVILSILQFLDWVTSGVVDGLAFTWFFITIAIFLNIMFGCFVDILENGRRESEGELACFNLILHVSKID